MSYQAGKTQTDGSIEWAPYAFLVMIMPLQDDLYWFQFGPEIKENEQEAYSLYLFKFESTVKQVSEIYVPVLTEDEGRQFAEQYRVTIGESENKPLSGSRDDILAFLKAHADVPLEGIDFE